MNGQVIQTALRFNKDPYILEFVGLPELVVIVKWIRTKVIDKLEHFYSELGKGFTFVVRQKNY